MQKKHTTTLQLESLENRLTPAFDAFFNPLTSTWTLTQVVDDNDADVFIDGAGDLNITDDAGTVTLGTAGANLTINMLPIGGFGVAVTDIFVDVGTTGLSGDLTVNLGNSFRFADIGGGIISGDVTVNGGGDVQVVFLTSLLSAAPLLDVGGAVNINLGSDIDAVVVEGDLSIGGNLNLRNVNDYLDAFDDNSQSLTIGGNVSFVVTEAIESEFDIDDMASVFIGGNVTFIGNNAEDNFDAEGSTVSIIGGNVYINLGNGSVFNTDDQDVDLEGVTIGGNLTVLAGTDETGFNDSIQTDADTVIGGNIYINTGFVSDGDVVVLLGQVGGSSITVITGLGDDSFQFGMSGNRPRVYASLGLGTDTFTLNSMASGTSLGSLYVDFGFGSDIFDNLFGAPFSFRAFLRNLP